MGGINQSFWNNWVHRGADYSVSCHVMGSNLILCTYLNDCSAEMQPHFSDSNPAGMSYLGMLAQICCIGSCLNLFAEQGGARPSAQDPLNLNFFWSEQCDEMNAEKMLRTFQNHKINPILLFIAVKYFHLAILCTKVSKSLVFSKE